jgi:uncharacterized protein (TIGR03545 family)
MKKTPLIRWRFVLPVGIFIAALAVFFIFFFDFLLARGIEIAGSKVNGAKVEVSGLKTKLFQGRLDIARLQVTNKEIPMQNIVDVGPMGFQIVFTELIKKRVIIPEASISGLQFNTARKTSGALPAVKKKQEEGKPSAASKLAAKYADRFKMNMSSVKFDAKEKVTFDEKDTAVYKQGEALKEKVNAMPDDWKAKVDALNVDERLNAIEAKLNEVKATKVDGADAIKTIPEGLKKLKEAKNDLNKLKSDVKAVRDQASAELKSVQGGVTGLQGAKQKDLDELLSRLNLDFVNPKRLVDGMIGPALLNRVHTILGYVQTARRVMPSKQEAESLPPKPRASGEDIRFWSPAALPRFWLKKSAVSGAFQGITASGLLQNATSNPPRIGKPTTLELKGAQGGREFNGNIIIDHVTDTKKDSLALHVKGLDVAEMVSSGGAQVNFLTGGSGGAEVVFKAIGEEQINGRIGLNLSHLKLNREALFQQVGLPSTIAANAGRDDRIKFDLMSKIAASLEQLPLVSIVANIGGTWSDPDLSIDSNLDNEISRIIKSSVGDVVAGQRKELEDKLQNVVKQQTASLNAKLAEVQSKLNGALGGHDAKIQKKIEEASGINLSSKEGGSPIPGLKVPSLDKLFKK